VNGAWSTFGELELLLLLLRLDSVNRGAVDDGGDGAGTQACEGIIFRFELHVGAIEFGIHAVSGSVAPN
jgi:hypothetical protein